MYHRAAWYQGSRVVRLAFLFSACVGPASATVATGEPAALELTLRTRQETSPGSKRFHTVLHPTRWEAAKTAIVVSDMWDQHWCAGATRRVAEMAGRMNQVLRAARERGVLIIHCPSDTLKFYEGTPARQLAQSAPPVAGGTPLAGWCALDREHEGPLPIDDSDGGCDCQPQCAQGHPWTRQISTLEIEPGDAVTDSAEAYYLMRQRGIDQVIVMGVHTNMCVLGRSFAIRQMIKLGQKVVLMRDLTDTMYNSRRRPRVSHFTGTDLVVEHIEKYWCPTVTSADLLGGEPFRFSADDRPHLVAVMAEDEYETERTLPPLLLEQLGPDFRLSLVYGADDSKHSIPGLEVLDQADVALFSVRRRILPREQLEPVLRYVKAGKPVVGIRTASHAFAAREDQAIPAGHAAWPDFDPLVLGGNYHGHHGNKVSPATRVQVLAAAAGHPILRGIDPAEFGVASWLYKVSPLVSGTEVLMMGRVEGRTPPEPVAWTFQRIDGGRSFYTSLGHQEDWKLEPVRRLLIQGIYWAVQRPAPENLPAAGSSTAATQSERQTIIAGADS